MSTVNQNYLFSASGQALNPQVNSAFADLISQINTVVDGKANLALSNLASVAINTSLLPGGSNTIGLGSSSFPFTSAYLKTSLILQQTGAGTNAITVAPPASVTTHTLTLPSAQGGASTFLMNDGSGGLSWATPVGTGATKALDNLASVAVNLALLPGTDNSIDLGSSSKRWVNLFAKDLNAGASGTAGSLSVFPATGSKGKILLSAADSGGNTTTTITNASQAGARTYTIPDAGASASFVMTEGAQTINGAKTLGAALALGSNKITGLGAATTAGDAVRYEQWHVAANVVYANTTSVTATSSTSLADITNLTAAITPSSASNKVLVRGMINIAVFPTSGNSQDVVVTLADGSGTALLQCDALAGGGGGALASEYIQGTYIFEYLDSPATASSKTYKFRIALAQASTNGTATVNYAAGAGGGNPTYSSITLQEIPA